ncbi:MAG: ABC transporter ATP-binding protein [Myxococcota bacterium]
MTAPEPAMPSTESPAEQPTAMLTLEGIRFAYGERQVLQGVDLTLNRGEIIGLLGPNGSGKSTLMGILCGLRDRSAGSITRDGAAIEPTSSAYRRDLGVVFQAPSLDLKLTARENLQLAGRLHGLDKATVSERIEAGLKDSGLTERADESVEQLSGGMRRRLDLARAMIHRPAMVLADEPTTGLDEAAFQRTWRQLEHLRDHSGAAILVTTHRPEEAERCDRLAVLAGGQIVCIDTPDTLRSRVQGDVLALEAEAPEAHIEAIKALATGTVRLDGQTVFVECERGHEVIVKIVEALPPGTLRSVEMRRPGLGDAFLKITGTSLEDE